MTIRLDMENPDLQKRADSIFADLKAVMNDSTAIIADLEAYRGSEADSGTIYEIGMAYARGLRCYGYTRDKRPLFWKDQKYVMQYGNVYAENGKLAPYKELPFSPCVVGSTKIIEGDFDDCLKMMMTDIEEEYKLVGKRGYGIDESSCRTLTQSERPIVYLAGLERYDADGVVEIKIDYEFTVAANLEGGTDFFKMRLQRCSDDHSRRLYQSGGAITNW